jgi:hypothetical protein
VIEERVKEGACDTRGEEMEPGAKAVLRHSFEALIRGGIGAFAGGAAFSIPFVGEGGAGLFLLILVPSSIFMLPVGIYGALSGQISSGINLQPRLPVVLLLGVAVSLSSVYAIAFYLNNPTIWTFFSVPPAISSVVAFLLGAWQWPAFEATEDLGRQRHHRQPR